MKEQNLKFLCNGTAKGNSNDFNRSVISVFDLI